MVPRRNKRKERFSPEPQTQPPSPKLYTNMLSSSSSSSPAIDFFSSSLVYPPGVRFVPTDEELIMYCKPGNLESWPNLPVHQMNIYESNPQQLSVEYMKGNLKEWFFITERTKMREGGKKLKRGGNGGYWHATVAAKKIKAQNGVVGYKTALAYYVGKQPNGVKTNWLMHEYWLESSKNNNVVDYALCKVYLSPMANKKKEEEDVEALKEEEVEQQPCGADSHQPQTYDNAYHEPHQPQFWPATLDSQQSQHRNIASHQPQFWPAPTDSNQLQSHDIAYHQPQPLKKKNTKDESFAKEDVEGEVKQPLNAAFQQSHPDDDDEFYELIINSFQILDNIDDLFTRWK